MPRTFRTTTSLVAATALAVPVPGWAQDTSTDTRDEIRLECALSLPDASATELRDCFIDQLPAYGLEAREEDFELDSYAIVPADSAVVDEAGDPVDGVVVEEQPGVAVETTVEEAVDEPVAVESAPVDAPVEPAPAEPALTEENDAAVVDGAEALRDETADAVMEEAAEEPAMTEETVEPALTTDPADPGMQATAPAETPAQPDTAAAPEAAPEAAPAGDAVTEDALAAELARQQETEAEAVETPAAPADADMTADGAVETPAGEPATQADLAAEGAANTTAQPADDAAATAAETDPAEVNPVQSDVAEQVAAQPVPELTEEEELARQQTEAALQSLESEGQVTAAAAAGDAEGTVEEQTITEADVRTSDEDFTTSAVETERDRDDDDDDGGLSNTQKIALGALGALAVGTLLNNRARVISNSGDRVVVQREDGNLTVLKDDDALLRQAGSNVRTESFDDGSTRTIVSREDGSQVITVRDASLRVLRRVLVRTDGTEVTLIDDTAEVAPVDVATLPPVNPAVVSTRTGDDALRDALLRDLGADRRYTLAQVRTIPQVRALAPAYEVSTVTFASGSAAIAPEQAGNLTDLARQVLGEIQADPRKVFLIEGHTDAVGDAAYNLALSDRRAESLALALNEYFQVPVENMVVQGYGEQYLKVPTQSDERANRRATVRDITGLLQTAAAN